jgi:carboxylesterase type B
VCSSDLDNDGKTPSTKIAELVPCPLEPYDDLLQCLRTKPAEDLIRAYKMFWKEDQKNGGLGFGGSNPVIQKAGKDRIIEVSPRSIFDSGNYSTVPMMFGANQQEGTLVLTYLYRDFLLVNDLLENSTFLAEDLIPTILKGLNIRDDTGTFTDALIDKYFVGAEMGNFTSMTPGLIDMLGALFLKQAGLETVRIHSKYQPNSYWYGFNYEGRLSLYPYLFPGEWEEFPWDHGVSHADEMIYLFAIPYPDGQGEVVKFNDEEQELSDRMINAWTNFVISGTPNPVGSNAPRWPEYTRADDLYMDIDKDWVVRKDYTQTYTVTVDEMRPPA